MFFISKKKKIQSALEFEIVYLDRQKLRQLTNSGTRKERTMYNDRVQLGICEQPAH